MDTAAIPQVEQGSSLGDYLDILTRRWWIIASVAAVALVSALVTSMSTPRVYNAAATVVVDRAGSAFGLTPDITGISQQAFVDTLVEIVKSRAVAELALDRLNVHSERAEGVRTLQAGLRVQRVRGADIIRVEAEGSSPESAADNSNAVALGFIDWHLQSRRAQAAAGREFIESQIALVGDELRTAENSLALYKAREGQVSLSEQTTIAVTKLADFEAQRRTAAAERQAIEASLRQASSALAQQEPTVPSTFVLSEDPVVSQLLQELTKLEIDLAGLLEQYTDDHPQVMVTQVQIGHVKARLRQVSADKITSKTITLNPLHQALAGQVINLEVDREAARAKEIAYGRIVDRYAREARAFPSKEVQLARLTRGARVAEQTYLLLSEKLQDAKIAEASIVGDLRIVDRAIAPETPIRPRTRMNLLFGVLLGLMLGAGAVLLLEAVDTTFKTPEEAGLVLGLPILGAIPMWRPADRKNAPQEVPLVTAEHRRSPFAEAFRHLRTNLLYLSPDRPLRRIQITSPGPGEGKSTVAANLAISVSQAGRRVWLVECDLRRPSLSWAFQPTTPAGLSDLLVDGMAIEEAVHTTSIDNLWFVPSGTKPPNPAELLGSQKMRSLLDRQTDGAEVIVLDAPPVLPVTDAAVLAPATDGVILVVQIGKTPRSAAQRALEHLEAVGARVIGVVANGVTPGRRGYYQYYSHYYQSETEEKAAQESPRA